MHQRTSFSGPISHLSQQAILVSSEGTHKRGENFPRTQIWLPGCIRLHVPFWTCISINSFASLQRLFMRNHYSDWFSSWSISSDYPYDPSQSQHLLEAICSCPAPVLCRRRSSGSFPLLPPPRRLQLAALLPSHHRCCWPACQDG